MILELIRNGGPLALVAVAMGGFGLFLGVLGLGARRTPLAILTLLLATGAAAAGIGSTLHGKRSVEQALNSVGPVMGDRIRRIGYAEAQGASLVGFAAALPALLLGTLALLSARAKSRSAAPVVASLMQVRVEDTSAVNLSGFAFVGIAGLAAAGALVLSRQAIPAGRYDFDVDDREAWDLATALAELPEETPDGCGRLDQALTPYFNVPPRPIPASLIWRPAADACIDRWLQGKDSLGLTEEGLLTSPLLQDEGRRAQVKLRLSPPETMKELFKEEPPGLSPRDVAPVVKKSSAAIRRCYERGLRNNPRLEGKLTVQFMIAANGSVSEALAAEPFLDDSVSSCVLAEFKRLKFPAHGGAPVKVKYPFVFNRSN